MDSRELGRLRVLVVDDNPHAIAIVKVLLRELGVQTIFEARSAEDAFRVICSEQIDLIFTDFELPRANGCDLVCWVRNLPDADRAMIPTVMLSAYTERSNIEAAREVGVTEFLAKPVTAQALHSKIAAIMNRQLTSKSIVWIT